MAPPIGTIIIALWAYLHTLQYGFHISALNGLQAPLSCGVAGGAPGGSHLTTTASFSLKPCVPMSSAYFGLVVSIFTIGGLAGSLSADIVTRSIGRIRTFQVSSTCVFLGSLAVGLANTPQVMLFGRVLLGFGCGLATVSVPLYLAELLPALRGLMGILNQLSIVFGLLLGQSLAFPFAKAFTWRYTMVVAVGVAAVQFAGGFMAKEARKGENLRRSVRNADEEAPLLAAAEEPALNLKGVLVSQDKLVRRGLVIVIVTQLAQQLCGVSPVMYFSTRILTPVFQNNSKYIALAIILIKIPMTLVPAIIVRRVGSKSILLGSAGTMALASVLLAIGINQNISGLSIIAIVTFVSAFSVGLGPVTWAVLSEVMPPHARTASGSIGLALNWSMNFIMGSSFLPLQEKLKTGPTTGEGNIFFGFGVTCLLSLIAIKTSYDAYERVSVL